MLHILVSLPEFIDSVDKVGANSAEQKEQCSLDTDEPTPLYQWDSDPHDTPDVRGIPYEFALESVGAFFVSKVFM